MPNLKNQAQMATIEKQLEVAQSVVFADYAGLSVAAQTKLRAAAKAAGGEFTVQKNTLLRKAVAAKLKDMPTQPDQQLEGPTAVLYGLSDAVSAIKALVTFAKDNEAVKIKWGFLTDDNKVMDAAGIEALSKLPSRQELIGQLLARLNSPIAGFVNVLNGNISGLARVLNAVREKKAASA